MNGIEAGKLINEYGANARPFVFILDFELLNCLVYPLDELPDWISFSIRNKRVGRAITEAVDSVSEFPLFDIKPVSFSKYERAFSEVLSEIQRGNTFLLNLSFPSLLNTTLSLSDIFKIADAPYRLLIDDICTVFSPECFVKINDGIISTFPMKGTISALIPGAEKLLLSNEKEIAEHATVVDLLRNDLSIYASEVRVDKFMYIDSVVTHAGPLLQMSSKISGKLPSNYNYIIGDILLSMLPAGSISGAPKRETLRIISREEHEPRNYYTGVFGVFDGTNLESSVMIRYIEKRDGRLWYRSGGGITSMSVAESEYREMIDKVYLPFRPNVNVNQGNNVF
ncbi:MAG TPA: aminodeoxychorismate synthase component I [Oligoflexia bacterium]|nr:aminodeoxychorismate synthase component I [Oligoflexia bacterium]HMP48718.1 aminodeoxychorismate synthase component I [Oligoflexia bacterium]